MNMNYKRKDRSNLSQESHILTCDISDLLSKYFFCEKLAKKLCNCKESLNLNSLKFKIKEYEIDICDDNLDFLFKTSLDNSKTKSFRKIRNKVVHGCSLFYRDFAIAHKKEYEILLDEFIEKVGVLFYK